MEKIVETVKCINNYLIEDLTVNKLYTIIDIHRNTESFLIKNDLNEAKWYIHLRFKFDISELRKQKFKEICSKQVIK